jgi:uncharacterized coiled-coil protein SlyX
VDEDPDRLRRALGEIEELIVEAERNGGRVDRWLRELAEELRNAVPERQAPPPAPAPPPVDGFRVALSMRSDPTRSIGAQARLDAQALKLLKD